MIDNFHVQHIVQTVRKMKKKVTCTWSVFVLAAIHASTKVSIALWKSIPSWGLNNSPGPRKSPPFVTYRVILEFSQTHNRQFQPWHLLIKRQMRSERCWQVSKPNVCFPYPLSVTWSTRAYDKYWWSREWHKTSFTIEITDVLRRAWNVRLFT